MQMYWLQLLYMACITHMYARLALNKTHVYITLNDVIVSMAMVTVYRLRTTVYIMEGSLIWSSIRSVIVIIIVCHFNISGLSFVQRAYI